MLMKGSEPSFMTADQAARRHGYAARSELALRDALEGFCRDRWPDARVVHELVMGQRSVRADVVAIDRAHIAAFEVKGSFDDTTRLLHQVGMYQLCVPEVWMVVPDDHEDDARLVGHLLPSVGLLVAHGMDRRTHAADRRGDGDGPAERAVLTVEREAAPRAVVPKMMLEMLWADELTVTCAALRIAIGKRATRPAMIKALLAQASEDDLTAETCARLRIRDALWRADAPVLRGDA